MISKKGSVLLIGFLLFFQPLCVYAEEYVSLSPDVSVFMEKNGMTVFQDPEIMAIQAELARYGQFEMEDFTAEESEKATQLINHLLSSIELVAREYMSGERVTETPVHTVQAYEELPSCVDDGSCSDEEQPQQLNQTEPLEVENHMSFGEMLNNNKPGSIQAVRDSLKL